MKTTPAKLLLALLFGFGCMSMVSAPAFAGDDKKKEESKDSKDSKDSKVSANASTCTGRVDTSCGVSVIVTTCTGSTPALEKTKAKDGSDEEDKDDHKSKDKVDGGKNDRERFEESHKDHANRSGDAKDGKIAICHRVGGSRVSLVVANDGWLNGHSKHALDTVGRCADFDDAKNDDSKKDSDKKISASDAGYSKGLTPSQVNCLSDLPGSVSIQSPTRGGARTLH